MQVTIKRHPKFAPLYDLPEDTEIVILIGGRGGMKTYEASKFAAVQATIGGKRIQVLRDEKEGIKESILNEVLLRYDTANKNGVMDRAFTRLENGIKSNKTGEMVVFTKGFRASSLDKKANMKSVSNVDIAIIEEGEDIRDEDKFNTFSDSIRKKGSFIVFIMNTPDIYHWIVRRYFNAVPITTEDEPRFDQKELDGYFKLTPKNVRGVVVIQTSFRDNEHLPEKTIRQYEEYGDHDSAMFNAHHYLTSIQGYSTTGLKGQVFKSYKLIEPDEFLSLDYAECYGLDFGTSSPAGIVWVKVHGNKVYVKELNYEPLKLVQLGKKLDELGFKEDTLIVADCAEPDTIRELRRGLMQYFDDEERERYPVAATGFGELRGSPDKSIVAGLDKLLSMEIYLTSDSPNLIQEFSRYVWQVDKDGKPSGKPIDAWNHCFVGHTKIQTANGLVRIDEMSEGNMVLTSSGYRKCLRVFNNGVKEINDYFLTFDDNIIHLTCTKDHKIKTTQGWIAIAELKEGMTIYRGNYSTGLSSTDTMAKSITARVEEDYMLSYGNTTTVKDRKGITSTIRTTIEKITTLVTWSALKVGSICRCTCNELTKMFSLREWTMRGCLQTSGTVHMKVENGTSSKLYKDGLTDRTRNLNVQSAVSSTRQGTQVSVNSAITTAKLKHFEIGESRKEKVYDLMINDVHEYVANGIVVHNCIDPLRYVIRVHGSWF